MTLEVTFYSPEPLRPAAIDVLRAAKAAAFGDLPVRLVPDPDSTLVLDNQFLMAYPLASSVIEQRFRTCNLHPFGPKTLYLDIESHSADDMWNMPIEEFFRLGQWAIGDGPIHTTTDLQVILDLMREAPGVVAHAGHSFDFSVLLGADALLWAKDQRLFDTKVHASLALPAPDTYTNRQGRKMIHASKPENAWRGWLSLDNLAFQLGLPGKEGDLKALAKKYGSFGAIPTDDPDYLTYAVQDIEVLRYLTSGLLRLMPLNDYAWREQLNAAIDAQNSRNGFTVDVGVAQARVAELLARKEEVLSMLQADYDFPSEGAKPWASKPGREALMKILADYGITPETRPDWTRTDTGNLSLGGKVLIELTEGTDAEELGQTLAEIMGQRTLAELALESVQDDGKVHPQITAVQRSGRKSTTQPGLTVWTKNVEKSYFVASPGCKLLSLDFSNADARVVAALSGDTEYAKRFEPGADGHEISGRIVFGEDYDINPSYYRNLSKPLGHGWNYGGQGAKLASVAKVSLEIAEKFVAQMNAQYPDLVRWQNEVRAQAAGGFVWNEWGRRMPVEFGRAFTQAPALLGQSGTREIMVDALIKMLYRDVRLIHWLVAQVHDELIVDIPEEHLDWAPQAYKECMETWWGPAQPIHFTVGMGQPADNWLDATHD